MRRSEEGGIVLDDDDEGALSMKRKEEIAKRAASISISRLPMDIQVDMSRAERLPLDWLTSLGAGFAPLSKAARAVTPSGEASSQQLLTVTDKFGNPLDVSALQVFNDESGIMGSYRDAVNGFGQARFHLADSQPVTASVPYDPASLFMAAALMEVNHRLDDIQKTQQEMIDYLKNRDKAKLRGDLDMLRDVLDNYRFNWSDEKYKTNKYALVQSIRKDASQAIIQQRAEVRQDFGRPSLPIHTDEDARRKARDVRERLVEYRLSVYLYGYSSFLEVMLLENFDHGYVANVLEEIESKALDYRSLYTEAYDAIEAEVDSSVRAGMLGGISGAMDALGKAVERTPIGGFTPIDEALIGAGDEVGRLNRDVRHGILGDLPDASSADIRPFTEGLEAIDHLYNDDLIFLADGNAIYVLPAEDSEVTEMGGDSDEGWRQG